MWYFGLSGLWHQHHSFQPSHIWGVEDFMGIDSLFDHDPDSTDWARPKYKIFGDPVNPDSASLLRARDTNTCVTFAVFVDGKPQEISLLPTEVYTPTSNFCIIKGRICGQEGPGAQGIEGMYDLRSRAYGGFYDS